MRTRIHSLYRRCLKSAGRCPDLKQQQIMADYTRGRFREALPPWARVDLMLKCVVPPRVLSESVEG